MCKAYEYVFNKCGHKHVKQLPCLGTTKVPAREGGERVFCTSVSIKVKEAKKPGKDKTFLKGDILTMHIEQACAACAKQGIIMRKAQKVVDLSDRYEGLGWSNYAQAKIDDSLAEYQRVKESLDREVPLPKPDGIYDNDFPGRPRFQHQVKRPSRLRNEIKLEDNPKVVAESDVVFQPSETVEEPPRKKVKLTVGREAVPRRSTLRTRSSRQVH